MFLDNYHYIMSNNTLASQHLDQLHIIYFAYAVIEWSTIFKYNFHILLYPLASATAVFETDIVPLTRMYASQ